MGLVSAIPDIIELKHGISRLRLSRDVDNMRTEPCFRVYPVIHRHPLTLHPRLFSFYP